MAQAAGKRHNSKTALQRHLEQLQLPTPQQQQLTVAALCQGVAAGDRAWVDVLVLAWAGAPRAIQQQLAAQPGLLKDLAGYLAHTNLSGSTAGAPAAESSASGGRTTRSGRQRGYSAECPPAQGGMAQQHQQQQQEGDSSGIRQSKMELATGMLAHLLCCCEACPPPPYSDLVPALHTALQQQRVCLVPLALIILRHHTGAMVADQQLLGAVLEAAEQGEGHAAAALAVLAPMVLQELEHRNPGRTAFHDRLTALLEGGTAAGAVLLEAALQQQECALFQAPGMVEAACSGLLAACREAASVCATTSTSSSSSKGGLQEEYPCLATPPPAHAVCLQYLRSVVGVAMDLGTRLAEVEGPLVLALAEAFSLLLESLQLPAGFKYGHGQRPYHDAAWAALLTLSKCRATTGLVGALFQQQQGLLQALATSWGQLEDKQVCEEPADNAARLAAVLLLDGTIPGQEERQQQGRLLEAGFRLWGSPKFWYRRAGLLVELLRLPQGPYAVMCSPSLLQAIFCNRLLRRHEQEGWELLLAAPAFATGLVEGLWRGDEACLAVVGAVWDCGGHIQALLAVPGLGDALAQCCSKEEECLAVDWLLGDAVHDEHLQEYLEQQPQLLQALVARLRLVPLHSSYFWDCVAEDDGADEWLLQQQVVVDGIMAALAVTSCYDAHSAARRLLEDYPTLLHSLLRQPSAMEALLRALVQRYWQPPSGHGSFCATQLLLLEELAGSWLAPRAMALLPGLLADADAELSAGVFEASNFIQAHMDPTLLWGYDLAATSSRAAPVQHTDEQLAALHQGLQEVQQAGAATAATAQQLRDQQQAAVAAAAAAGAQGEEGPHQPGRSKGGTLRLQKHRAGAPQQPAQLGVELRSAAGRQQQVARSSSSKRKGATCQRAAAAAAGSKRDAGGRRVPGRVPASSSAAAGAAAAAASSEDVGVPPAPSGKRTRR